MVKGFLFSASRAGLKRKGDDIALIYAPDGCVTAAVFTTNKFAAPSVIRGRQQVRHSSPFVVLANSGNANACTGRRGLLVTHALAGKLARLLGAKPADVLMSSTGIIGVQLPQGKIAANLPRLVQKMNPEGWQGFAQAITTTDRYTKVARTTVKLGRKNVTLLGMAKGAGMIHPSMATMLAYICTDADIDKKTLQAITTEVADRTFNAIIVDGDTSTNDSLVVMASKAAGNAPIRKKTTPTARKFAAALYEVCEKLALDIVHDGEGASRVMRLTVTGAKSDKQAKKAAQSVAKSQLVQCALFGADPNWGRIIAAVGYSGIDCNPEKVGIRVGKVQLVKNGTPCKKAPKKLFAGDTVECTVQLNVGKGVATVWFSDLNYDYVKVNSCYHT